MNVLESQRAMGPEANAFPTVEPGGIKALLNRGQVDARAHLWSAPRRVLLTSRSGQLGGMEMRIADEARFLAARNADCYLAFSDFPERDPWLANLTAESPRFERFDFDPPPFFEEWRWRRLRKLIATKLWPTRLMRFRFDLAHIGYAWTMEGGSRLALCHRAGIPCVLSVHNAFPHVSFSDWHARITSDSFAAVRGIYAVSQSALDHFLGIYGTYVRDSTVVRVVPNFVDVDRFAPSTESRRHMRHELGIPQDAVVVGSIGRLDTQKEPEKLVQVFDIIWNARSDACLVFCGQGPLSEAAQALVSRKPWRDRVRFLGFRDDVEKVFPALDVHLLLSKQEGFGITTVESFACGVPVIATNVPGTRDVMTAVGDDHLVEYGDIEGTALAVLDLLRDPDQRARIGERARSEVIRKFSKARWETKLAGFYEAVFSSAQS